MNKEREPMPVADDAEGLLPEAMGLDPMGPFGPSYEEGNADAVEPR